MDWTNAIARKRRELSAIAASLAALLAFGAVRAEILWILRPAESAVRRLVVLVMRHGLPPKLLAKLYAKAQAAHFAKQNAKADGLEQGERDGKEHFDFSCLNQTIEGAPRFQLIDLRKRFCDALVETPRFGPRIWVAGMARHDGRKPGTAQIGIEKVALRVKALKAALDDLDRQAKRLALLLARRAFAPPGTGSVGPLRPGLPPGFRARQPHRVDAVLLDCHMLVIDSNWRPPPLAQKS